MKIMICENEVEKLMECIEARKKALKAAIKKMAVEGKEDEVEEIIGEARGDFEFEIPLTKEMVGFEDEEKMEGSENEEMTGFGLAEIKPEGAVFLTVKYDILKDEPIFLFINNELAEFGKDYRYARNYGDIFVLKQTPNNAQFTIIYTFRNKHGDKEIISTTTELNYPKKKKKWFRRRGERR